MTRRWAACAVAAIIGTAGPAGAQSVGGDVLPHDLANDIERVVEKAAALAASAVETHMRGLERELGRAGSAERTPQGRNRGRVERSETTTRSYDIGAAGNLDLRNVAGNITVTSGGGREVRIEIVKQAAAGSESDAARGLKEVDVTTDQRGERLVVETVYPRGRTPYSVNTTFIVTAPAGTRINVRSVSGEVEVRGITGDVIAETISGNIRVSQAGRVSRAQSVSGDVTVEGITSDGTVSAGTVSGNIAMSQVRTRRITAENVSGRIRAENVTCDAALLKSLSGTVEFVGPLSRSGRYELQSHSGTVRLAVNGNVGFELQAKSFSGRIRPENLSLQAITMNRGSMRATVGDASAMVIAGTFSGDVIVERR
jgi:DUF4097 and DUF4098 domain-containing protein YvlB